MLFDTRPKVQVTLPQTGESYACATTESLLQGMVKLGRRGIPVGCVNGGCGVCKVRIVEGEVKALGPVSRAHVSVEEEAAGITLACRVGPVTAVSVQVVGKMEKPFSKGFEKASVLQR
jgi:3-phenylpropionate/trans-cinnamate dioxygenase ferredoxin reductase subunit